MTIPIKDTAPGGNPGGGKGDKEQGRLLSNLLYDNPTLAEYLNFVPPPPASWDYARLAEKYGRWTRTFLHMRRPDLAGIACIDYLRAREYARGVCFTREYGG